MLTVRQLIDKPLTKPVNLSLDWLRAQSDQQLLEHKTAIDKMIADYAQAKNQQNPDFEQVECFTEYLNQTEGFDRALEYINALNREKQAEAYYFTKISFFLRHERTNELEAYIQELTQRQISSPQLSSLCLKFYLGLGQRQRAESFLSNLISNYPGSDRLIIEAISLARVFSLDFDLLEFKNNVGFGEAFIALEQKIAGSECAETLPTVYCINLDRSTQRMDRCADLYRGNAELCRIPAVSGNDLPEYLLRRITINPAIPKSAVGCSLSHISAWEKIAESDESSPAKIVVEDDGLPLWGNLAACGIVQKLMAQHKFDLLYIQDSATPLQFAIREFTPGWKPEALPFQAGLERFMQHQRKSLPPGWGLYGYCLSVRGARKLLTLLERDGVANHIDWQTFLYSASDWNHPMVRSKNNIAINYQRTTKRAPQHELNSGILNFPVITHADFFRSTR